MGKSQHRRFPYAKKLLGPGRMFEDDWRCQQNNEKDENSVVESIIR
jgi:hypothetical protein